MPQSTTHPTGRYRPTRPMTQIPCDLPVLLDVRTAAEIGGFSEKFIRDQLGRGAIRGCKIGKAWRIHRDAYLGQLGIG